jgi:uncharacterized membrane protein YhdT
MKYEITCAKFSNEISISYESIYSIGCVEFSISFKISEIFVCILFVVICYKSIIFFCWFCLSSSVQSAFSYDESD